MIRQAGGVAAAPALWSLCVSGMADPGTEGGDDPCNGEGKEGPPGAAAQGGAQTATGPAARGR
eukprot:gene38124-11368_t